MRPKGPHLHAFGGSVMPSSESILTGLAAIANERRLIAEGWHVALGVFVLALGVGWRPSIRVLGGLLVVPVLSVSATAWVSGNPFNAATFALLAALLTGLASRWPRERTQLAAPTFVWAGAGSLALGWLYPHLGTSRSAGPADVGRTRPLEVHI